MLSIIKLWFSTLRIKQWNKNFFVLAPFLFSYKFGINEYFWKSLSGVFLFSLMSSAIYIFNDVVDLKYDSKHPEKRFRPIASGKISVHTAWSVSILLFLFSAVLSSLFDFEFLLILILYVINNLFYTYYFKNKTVLDIMSIAFGFLLRVYAGGYLINISITKWTFASVFCLSFLLGFGKRRAEIEDLMQEARTVRNIFESYTVNKLNVLLGISASITIMTYLIFCMSPETAVIHGTDKLIYTSPLVIYCIYRYILKVQEKNRGGEPLEIIFKDRGFVLAGILWIIFTLYLMHEEYFKEVLFRTASLLTHAIF